MNIRSNKVSYLAFELDNSISLIVGHDRMGSWWARRLLRNVLDRIIDDY